MTDKNYTENSEIKNEFSKVFDAIDEILSQKAKEERLEYFSAKSIIRM